MNQNNQIQKLTLDEIEHFIKNPLPPPIKFTDRYYSGDFGLLPTEIWDIIYQMKYDLEKQELNNIKEKHNENLRTTDELQIQKYQLRKNNINTFPEFEYIQKMYNREGNRPFDGISSFFYFMDEHLLENEEDDKKERFHKILCQKRPRIANKEFVRDTLQDCVISLQNMIEDCIYHGSSDAPLWIKTFDLMYPFNYNYENKEVREKQSEIYQMKSNDDDLRAEMTKMGCIIYDKFQPAYLSAVYKRCFNLKDLDKGAYKSVHN